MKRLLFLLLILSFPLTGTAQTSVTVDANGNVINGKPTNFRTLGHKLTVDGVEITGGGGASLPTQTGNSGKFLTTNGTAASWGHDLFSALNFTSSNLTSIATRNFSDLQNIPNIGTYTYFIRLIAGTPTAFDASGIQVSSNADTGALVNALMPTLSVNPTGVVFQFDRGAFPFATSIIHDTPTIKNDTGSVTYLAPVIISGAGGLDAQDTTEPKKMLGTLFYPTSGFTSTAPLIKVNPSATDSRLAFGVDFRDFGILCTSGGAASSQSDSPAYAANPGLCAGISVVNPSNGGIDRVWVGSANGDGISVTTTLSSVGSGATFKVNRCWVNANQGAPGSAAFRITLDDCEASNLFAYYTFPNNTDFIIGSGHDQPVRLINVDSNANNGGTVLELAGSAVVNGLVSHGTGVNPVIFIKKSGNGDSVIVGSSMIDTRSAGAVAFYYTGGTGMTLLSGCHFNGFNTSSELVELGADVSASASLRFTNCGVYGTGISASYYNTNSHTDFVTKQFGPFTSNLTALAAYKDVQLGVANAFTGFDTFSRDPGDQVTPVTRFTNTRTTTSGQFANVLERLAPNLAAGGIAYDSFGVSATTNNRASIEFYYAGAGSANNYLGLGGFYGATGILAMFPSGGAVFTPSGTPTDPGVGKVVSDGVGAGAYFRLQNDASGRTSSDGFDLILGTSSDGYLWNRENGPIYFGANNAQVGEWFPSSGLVIGSSGSDPGAGNLLATGATFSGGSLTLSGNQSAAAWTTSGIRLKGISGTLTDTTSSGTVAAAYTNKLGGNTIAASSATTFTNYISGYFSEPVAGTNVTLTNKWGLGADSLYVGTSNPLTVSNAGVLTLTAAAALGTPASVNLANATFPTLNQNTTGSAASLSVSGQTGLLTVTGLASTNRAKTVRDAADTILELGGSYTPTGTWTSLPLTNPKVTTGINDANGNSMLAFTATASAVDGFTFTNAATANPATVTMSATGSDSNIGVAITPKGTGGIWTGRIGTAANPAFAPTASTGTGIWFRSNSNIDLTVNGVDQFSFNTTGINAASGLKIGWVSGAPDATGIDTAFVRSNAAIIDAINGTAGQWGSMRMGVRDSGTTTVTNGLTVGHQSTGTPAAGLGSAILFNIDSSTTADQNAAKAYTAWETATHASRTSYIGLQSLGKSQALTDRYIGGGSINVATNAAALSLFDIALTTLKGAAGTITYEVFATDGTDVQVRSGSARYSSVNKGGSYTHEVAIVNEGVSASTGTLTATLAFSSGTNLDTLQITPNSSLTATTYYVQYSIQNLSESTITVK